MHPDFPEILPFAGETVEQAFATHQISHEFYREVQYREELEDYCQWYYATAEANRQQLIKMQGELNILNWFWRK